jgi:hypothetical protein
MESPEAPKVALHVEQARRLVRFMVVSEVEFGGFFQEIESISGHEQETEGTYHAERCGGGGRLRSEHESPEYQECGKQRADGNKD